MTTLELQAAASFNQWLAIAPEIFVVVVALVLLVLEMVLPKEHHILIPAVAIVCQVAIGIGMIVNLDSVFLTTGPTFNGLIRHSAEGQFLRLFFLLCSILVC